MRITRFQSQTTHLIAFNAASEIGAVIGTVGHPFRREELNPVADGSRHFGVAGVGQQDEDALQGAQTDEDVPQWGHIGCSGDQSGDPGEAHDQRQADVETQLLLGAVLIAGRGRLGRGAADHVGRADEEEQVDGEDAQERSGEEDQDGASLTEPANVASEGRMVLGRDPRSRGGVHQLDEQGASDHEGGDDPGVERIERETTPLVAGRGAQLDGGHADGPPHVPGQDGRPPERAQEEIVSGDGHAQAERIARRNELGQHERAVSGEEGERQRRQIPSGQVAQFRADEEGDQMQHQTHFRQTQSGHGDPTQDGTELGHGHQSFGADQHSAAICQSPELSFFQHFVAGYDVQCSVLQPLDFAVDQQEFRTQFEPTRLVRLRFFFFQRRFRRRYRIGLIAI